MRSRRAAAAAVVAALAGAVVGALVGCGGGRREQIEREAERFDCRGRRASYTIARDLAGNTSGVQLDCADAGPRIRRWRTDKAGKRQDDARGLTPGEFDKVWRELDGTGWPYLHDCENGSGGRYDPIYKFEIADDQNHAAFQCQSQSMPYPYNDLVDPLDLAAQAGRHQLGDDEPAELKALDKKDKQR